MQPLISIIIPVKNEERTIEKCVRSLQALTYPNYEIIVVNDGSTDRTAAIAGAMRGVRLVRHPHNRGYGAALKTGYAAATGEWIGFLDADGTYPPEYFPQLCKVALARNADIVIGSRMAGSDSQMPVTRRIGN